MWSLCKCVIVQVYTPITYDRMEELLKETAKETNGKDCTFLVGDWNAVKEFFIDSIASDFLHWARMYEAPISYYVHFSPRVKWQNR